MAEIRHYVRKNGETIGHDTHRKSRRVVVRLAAVRSSALRRSAQRVRKQQMTAVVRDAASNVASGIGIEELTSASASATDVDVLLELLRVADARDPLASARLRGLEIKRQLLEDEGYFTIGEAGQALNRPVAHIEQEREAGHLLAVDHPQGELYPAWQFTPFGVLPGLDGALEALDGMSPWNQLGFMLSGNAWLGGQRPLDALREGNLEAVRHAAASYGEQSGV